LPITIVGRNIDVDDKDDY